jgi:orotate phosphoribosyltransferase/orotidine 5'-phosphate decarboxylase subfamily 1
MHLIPTLKKHNIIKTGDFTLKSGMKSNLYFDFKSVTSYPDLLSDLSYELSKMIKDDITLCGVPLGGIPYAVLIGHIKSRPIVLLRDEKKSYGMGNQVEGKCDGNVILIEDVITTGSSVISCIETLKTCNIYVKHVVCILDREVGGVQAIQDLGYEVNCLYKMSEILNYVECSTIIKCEITERLLSIVNAKQTNVIASLDCDNLYEIMEKIGAHVCAVKIHGDIYKNLDVERINYLKGKLNFMVIEDRKFSDIPYIALKQLELIKSYADIVTVHGICGNLMVEKIGEHIGVIIVHSMSVKDNLINRTYMDKVLDMKPKNLVGYVSQEKVNGYLTFMPGISMEVSTDNLGQCYKTVENCGADIFIVGRGIYEGDYPLLSALMYKENCWKGPIG